MRCVIILLLIISFRADAQRQLLLLKGERVHLRLNPGDEISFKLKNNKRVWTTYINNLSDTAVVTHRDTIAYHRIERMYFEQSTFASRIGAALVVGGTTLFLIDQLNYTVIQGNEPSLDAWVSRVSLGAIAIGLPMVLIKKKYRRLNHRYRLMMIEKSSPFYVPPRNTGF